MNVSIGVLDDASPDELRPCGAAVEIDSATVQALDGDALAKLTASPAGSLEAVSQARSAPSRRCCPPAPTAPIRARRTDRHCQPPAAEVSRR